MVVRIVKMEFQEAKVSDFINLFNSVQQKITGFDGCEKVELLKSVDSPSTFFTYSTWKSEQHLENYRNSELFKQTWTETKKMFSNKAEAWSLTQSGMVN